MSWYLFLCTYIACSVLWPVVCDWVCVCCCLFTLAPTDGLSFLNENGGLKVFFPRNSFVTNTTLTHTNTPRNMDPSAGTGRDHIACYGGDPNAAQVTWHDSSGQALVVCGGTTTPVLCQSCGNICDNNGGVGVDPPLNGTTTIHLFTDDTFMNQDLQCRVNGDQSAFIGVYVKNGGGFSSTQLNWL